MPIPIQVNDRVQYTDEYGTRIGTVIEIDTIAMRARIKWDDRKLRTWIKMTRLVKIINP